MSGYMPHVHVLPYVIATFKSMYLIFSPKTTYLELDIYIWVYIYIIYVYIYIFYIYVRQSAKTRVLDFKNQILSFAAMLLWLLLLESKSATTWIIGVLSMHTTMPDWWLHWCFTILRSLHWNTSHSPNSGFRCFSHMMIFWSKKIVVVSHRITASFTFHS